MWGITCGEATKQNIVAAAAAATTTTTTTNTSTTTTDRKSAMQYENIDSLPQRAVLKTVPSYENIPGVSSPHQSNIEMNHCPAYGVLKEKSHTINQLQMTWILLNFMCGKPLLSVYTGRLSHYCFNNYYLFTDLSSIIQTFVSVKK